MSTSSQTNEPSPPWYPATIDIAKLGFDQKQLATLTSIMESAYLAGRADALREYAARLNNIQAALGRKSPG
jgi:hypothetical protein